MFNFSVTRPGSVVPVLHLRHPTSCIQTRFQALHVLPIGTRGAGTACGGVERFLLLFLFLSLFLFLFLFLTETN